MHRAGCRRIALPPLRPGRVQVENGQARVSAFGTPRGKETTAVGKRQQIADQRRVPRAIGHPGGQHLVEDITTGRGQQARADIALLGQSLALGPLASVKHIAAGVTEALGSEVIRHALVLELFQARA
ncbi:hypothetical protein D3C80_1487630 [compost metagenome]